MEEHKLAELLRIQSAEVSGQTPFCPEAELIVKYFEGTLIEQEHAGLKRHLAECRFCLARIGNLERLDVSDDDPEAPGTVLADAKRLVKVSSAPRFRHATAWATADVTHCSLAKPKTDRSRSITI